VILGEVVVTNPFSIFVSVFFVIVGGKDGGKKKKFHGTPALHCGPRVGKSGPDFEIASGSRPRRASSECMRRLVEKFELSG
jgi:hypothetical protein